MATLLGIEFSTVENQVSQCDEQTFRSTSAFEEEREREREREGGRVIESHAHLVNPTCQWVIVKRV